MRTPALTVTAAMAWFLLAAPSPGFATEDPAHDHDHGAAASASPEQSPAPDKAMQQMQDMHRRMMAAKTPQERQALMDAHMKAMQQGMQAMQHMGAMSCTDKAGTQMRMDMMSMMMQMMADRQSMMSGMSMDHHATAADPSSTPKK